jgi:hypothetical protein
MYVTLLRVFLSVSLVMICTPLVLVEHDYSLLF